MGVGWRSRDPVSRLAQPIWILCENRLIINISYMVRKTKTNKIHQVSSTNTSAMHALVAKISNGNLYQREKEKKNHNRAFNVTFSN